MENIENNEGSACLHACIKNPRAEERGEVVVSPSHHPLSNVAQLNDGKSLVGPDQIPVSMWTCQNSYKRRRRSAGFSCFVERQTRLSRRISGPLLATASHKKPTILLLVSVNRVNEDRHYKVIVFVNTINRRRQ